MLVTNHVLLGAAIGSVAPGPGTAAVLGVASHFALDSLPHWGDRPIEDVMHVAVTDGLLGLAAMALLTARATPERRRAVLAGMSGAAFPDLDKPSRIFLGFSPFPDVVDRFHAAIQRESAHRMPQEVLVGLGLLGLALAAVRRR